MRTLAVIVAVLAMHLSAFSQSDLPLHTLDRLYIAALDARMDIALQSGYSYIQPSEISERIKGRISNERFKFLSVDELVKKSIKGKETIRLLRLTDSIISKDTIDINFEYVSFKAKRCIYFHKWKLYFKRIYIYTTKSNTSSYQPDIRFVYDNQRKTWAIAKNKFINTSK